MTPVRQSRKQTIFFLFHEVSLTLSTLFSPSFISLYSPDFHNRANSLGEELGRLSLPIDDNARSHEPNDLDSILFARDDESFASDTLGESTTDPNGSPPCFVPSCPLPPDNNPNSPSLPANGQQENLCLLPGDVPFMNSPSSLESNNTTNVSNLEVHGTLPPIIGNNNVITINVGSRAEASNAVASMPQSAAQTPSTPCDFLPAVTPEFREHLEKTRHQELRTLFQMVRHSPITLLYGPFGIGKTQTAIEVARRLATTGCFQPYHVAITRRTEDEIIFMMLHALIFDEVVKECPFERFLRALKADPRDRVVVLDVGHDFFDVSRRDFLLRLSSGHKLKLLLASNVEPLDLPENCPTFELKPFSMAVSKILISLKGYFICGVDTPKYSCPDGCQEAGCRIARLAKGVPLYLNILSASIARGESIEDVVVGEDFEQLHSWLFQRFSQQEIEIVVAASVFDYPFDQSFCQDIVDKAAHSILSRTLTKMGSRFVFNTYEKRDERHFYVMHPCLKAFLRVHRNFNEAEKKFLENQMRNLMRLTVASWCRDGMKDAVQEFKSDLPRYQQLLSAVNQAEGDHLIAFRSLFIEYFRGCEWKFVKMFMFLECCLPFKMVEYFAAGIAKICEVSDASSNVDALNLRVLSLCYRNEILRRQFRSVIAYVNSAKNLLFEVAPPAENAERPTKSLMTDAHPCPPCVRWYYHYASGRSFAASRKPEKARTDYEKAINLIQRFTGENIGQEAHRQMDLWEYQMCLSKCPPPDGEDGNAAEGNLDLEAYHVNLQMARNFEYSLGNHEQTSTAYKRVGDFCLEKKFHYEEAIENYRRAYAIMRHLGHGDDVRAIGDDDEIAEWPQTMMILKNMACAQFYLDDVSDAWLKTMKRAEALSIKYFPDSLHVWVLKLCKDFAQFHYHCGQTGRGVRNFAEAAFYAEKGIEICLHFQRESQSSNQRRKEYLEDILENCRAQNHAS